MIFIISFFTFCAYPALKARFSAGFVLDKNAGSRASAEYAGMLDVFNFIYFSQKKTLPVYVQWLFILEGIADTFDDRHHCHECAKLVNNRCIAQRYKPCDIVPRRCPDFSAKRYL